MLFSSFISSTQAFFNVSLHVLFVFASFFRSRKFVTKVMLCFFYFYKVFLFFRIRCIAIGGTIATIWKVFSTNIYKNKSIYKTKKYKQKMFERTKLFLFCTYLYVFFLNQILNVFVKWGRMRLFSRTMRGEWYFFKTDST